MMDDLISRTSFGTGGFLATIGLSEVNAVVSLFVGLATLMYMGISIYKLLNK
jgi:hypothetical protein